MNGTEMKTVATPKERHHKTYWNQIPELLDRETLQFLLDTDTRVSDSELNRHGLLPLPGGNCISIPSER